jgi:hypothetical protein
MSDVDPFGRKAGEDSLKEMGWSVPASSSAPTTTPVSTGSSAPASTPPAAPPTRPAPIRPRRSGFGRLVLLLRLVVPVGIVVAIGFGVASGVKTAKHTLSIPQFTVPNITLPQITPPSATSSKPATLPTGLARGSLLRPAAMRTAVARLNQLGRLNDLRVAPDRINAQLVRGATLRITQVSSDGTVTRNDVDGAGASLSTFPWSYVNALAPTRMVRATGRRPSTVDYLVLIEFAGRPSWNLYFKDGTHYSAGADGRHPQRL